MDTYQAVYDATRSKINNCDTHDAVSRAASEAFQSFNGHIIQQEFCIAAAEMARPSAIFRPALIEDGDHWCALYGDNLASGLGAFGKTPEAAMAAFDKAWHSQKTSTAMRAEEAHEERAANGQFGVGA